MNVRHLTKSSWIRNRAVCHVKQQQQNKVTRLLKLIMTHGVLRLCCEVWSCEIGKWQTSLTSCVLSCEVKSKRLQNIMLWVVGIFHCGLFSFPHSFYVCQTSIHTILCFYNSSKFLLSNSGEHIIDQKGQFCHHFIHFWQNEVA